MSSSIPLSSNNKEHDSKDSSNDDVNSIMSFHDHDDFFFDEEKIDNFNIESNKENNANVIEINDDSDDNEISTTRLGVIDKLKKLN